MTTLHVIYDPNDKISHDADRNKEIGIRVAILSISDDIVSPVELEKLATELGFKLLVQFHQPNV